MAELRVRKLSNRVVAWCRPRDQAVQRHRKQALGGNCYPVDSRNDHSPLVLLQAPVIAFAQSSALMLNRRPRFGGSDGRSSMFLLNSVSTGPGQTFITRMPLCRVSILRMSAYAFSACFEAEYTPRPGMGSIPAIELTMTTVPPRGMIGSSLRVISDGSEHVECHQAPRVFRVGRV